MLKIYLTLVLAVSLSCLAQPQRRRYSMTQYREGAARSSSDPYHQQEARFDPRNQYPTSPRTVDYFQYSTSPRSVDYYNKFSTNQRNVDYDQYSANQREVDSNQYPTNPRTVDHHNQYVANNKPEDHYNQYPSSSRSEDEQYHTSSKFEDAGYFSTSPRPAVNNRYPNNPRTVQVSNHYSTSPRTIEVSSRYPTSQRTVEVSNEYPTSPTSVEGETVRNKYRRKPKKTYYPKVVTFYQKPTTNNGYEFKYVTADGVQRAERGYLSEKGVWTVEGSVTSIDDDNVAVVQSYVADGSGYKSSVRRHSAGSFRSLDDFLPWASDVSDTQSVDDDVHERLGDLTINSLVRGG